MSVRQNEQVIALDTILKDLELDLNQRKNKLKEKLSRTFDRVTLTGKRHPASDSYNFIESKFVLLYENMNRNIMTDETIEKYFEEIKNDNAILSSPYKNDLNVIIDIYKKMTQQHIFLLQAQALQQWKNSNLTSVKSTTENLQEKIKTYHQFMNDFEKDMNEPGMYSELLECSTGEFLELSKSIQNDSLEKDSNLITLLQDNIDQIKKTYNEDYNEIMERINSLKKSHAHVKEMTEDYQKQYGEYEKYIQNLPENINQKQAIKNADEKLNHLNKIYHGLQECIDSYNKKKNKLQNLLQLLKEPIVPTDKHISDFNSVAALKTIKRHHDEFNWNAELITRKTIRCAETIDTLHRSLLVFDDKEKSFMESCGGIVAKQKDINQLNDSLKTSFKTLPHTLFGKIANFFYSFKLSSLLAFTKNLFSNLKGIQNNPTHQNGFPLAIDKFNHFHEESMKKWNTKCQSFSEDYSKLEQLGLKNIKQIEKDYYDKKLAKTRRKYDEVKKCGEEITKAQSFTLSMLPSVVHLKHVHPLNETSVEHKHLYLSHTLVKNMPHHHSNTSTHMKHVSHRSIELTEFTQLPNVSTHNSPIDDPIGVKKQPIQKNIVTIPSQFSNKTTPKKESIFDKFATLFSGKIQNTLKTIVDFERELTKNVTKHSFPNEVQSEYKKDIKNRVKTNKDILLECDSSVIANEIKNLLLDKSYSHLSVKNFENEQYAYLLQLLISANKNAVNKK